MCFRIRTEFFVFIGLILFTITGCPRKAPPPPPSVNESKPVRLLVLDDPPLAEEIERVWRSRSEAVLEVRQARLDETLEQSRLNADAVVYPSALLGELLARDWLLPFSKEMQENSDLNQADVLDLLRLQEIRWGEATYAASFGSPVVLLAYRADVFKAAGVAPPASWDEYHQTAIKLAQSEHDKSSADSEKQPWSGTVEPWASGWAGQTLLVRAAAYARHHDQYSDVFDITSMEPLIGGPPFVRALEEMAAVAPSASPKSLNRTPLDAYRDVVEGRAAMALCWPSATVSFQPREGVEVRWSRIPASREVYHQSARRWEQRESDEETHIPLLATSGRLGSITRETSRSQAALHVLAVLSGSWGQDLAPASAATTLYRQSQLTSPGKWMPKSADADSAESYAEAIEQSLTQGVGMFSPRIPGRARYLAVLDEAVRRALQGEVSPAESLAQAAEQWRKTTGEIGLDQQRDAYQRSLGLEP
jgi:multiple sugar transport system substrate-binding protein